MTYLYIMSCPHTPVCPMIHIKHMYIIPFPLSLGLRCCHSICCWAINQGCVGRHPNTWWVAKFLFWSSIGPSHFLRSKLYIGGNGYINDYPTGRFLRDAKLYEIGAGTSEIRRLVIGRALNKEYSQWLQGSSHAVFEPIKTSLTLNQLASSWTASSFMCIWCFYLYWREVIDFCTLSMHILLWSI